jgi:hypothetical protein
MRQLIFSRRAYWVLVATLIALNVGLVLIMLSAPETYPILRYAQLAIFPVLALVVGGRFADIGWPRWLGITLALLIITVIPIAIIFFTSPRVPAGARYPDNLPDSDFHWVHSVLLLLLLIVAGIKRSASGPDAGNGGTSTDYDNRKEPTFP